jgi:phosphoribosylaminoimidazole-succinocarboxamide synthase
VLFVSSKSRFDGNFSQNPRRLPLEIRKGKLLKDGKTKKVFATGNPEVLVFSFKNEIPIGEKHELFKGKTIGKHAAAVSGHVFRFLANYHIATHFIDVPKPGEMAVRKLGMIPLTVWVWNGASGYLCRRYGFEKGRILDLPIVETYWKNEALHNPMIQNDHALALGLIRQQEMTEIDRQARKINAILKDFFARRNLKLADFTLEFGFLNNDIVLGDEFSPETFRVWDVTREGNIDSSRFQLGKHDAETIFSEIAGRIEMH